VHQTFPPAGTVQVTSTTTRTFEQIHADFGEINGGHFLVFFDSFRGRPHLVAFRDKITTALQVVEQERKLFSNVGAHPLTFWSDNGLNLEQQSSGHSRPIGG
jgi:hypothetical protein